MRLFELAFLDKSFIPFCSILPQVGVEMINEDFEKEPKIIRMPKCKTATASFESEH